MKIAFLNLHQGAVERGLETFIYELARRLSAKHEVEVIAGNGKIQARWPVLWRFFLDPNGVSVFWFTLKCVPKIFREKYDVIIPGNGGWQPALIRIVTWLYGGKMVISGQSGIGWDEINNLWCLPDSFVALSSFAKNWVKKINPFIKVALIPNGVDIKKFTPDGPKLRISLSHPIIICVGALTKSKRIDLVIRATSKLKNVSLLIVGKGELKDELEELGKELLGKRFQLISLPFREMPKVYRACDLFVLVSQPFHSFEIALVEALASNLPVVVNDDPIRKEIVGDSGILVEPTDIKSFTDAIEKALIKDWRDKPRKQAEKFSWEIIAKKYEKLFEDLLK